LESNKYAIRILLTLVLTSVSVFFLERKFLIAEIRGETISNYSNVDWADNIVLLVDDFEGLSDSISVQKAGFFGYGKAKISLDSTKVDKNVLASKTCMQISWAGKDGFAGWGKGVGKNVDLNTAVDYLNLRVLLPKGIGSSETLTVKLDEDDNSNGILDEDKDDCWTYKLKIVPSDKWQMVSIPLTGFVDSNEGGDAILNISRKGGLHTIIFSFDQVDKYTPDYKWYFDFICFTDKKIKG